MRSRVILQPISATNRGGDSAQGLWFWPTLGRHALFLDPYAWNESTWTFVAPGGLVPPIQAVVTYSALQAASGGCALAAYIEAITPGDALDLDSADGWDAVNGVTFTAPSVAQVFAQIAIPCTNYDAMAGADYVRFILGRWTDHAADTAVNTIMVWGIDIQDSSG